MKAMKCMAVLGLAVALAACGDKEKEEERSPTAVAGQTGVAIDTQMITTRVGEAAIGNYLADALLEEVRLLSKAADVAFVNAGAIRGGAMEAGGALGKIYPAGDLTNGDIAGWLPFNNDHAIVEVTGTQLKSILERGVSSLPPNLKEDQGGWFLHVAGMTYTVSCAGTPQKLNAAGDAVEQDGSRIVKIEVGGQVMFDSTGAELIDRLEDTKVKIVTNSFLTTGADGHVALKAASATQEILSVTDFDFIKKLQERVERTSPIAPAKDGRIAIQGECSKPGTMP